MSWSQRPARIVMLAGVLTLTAVGAGWLAVELLTTSDAELRAMPTRELLLIVHHEQDRSDAQSCGNRAGREVMSRPRDVVLQDLRGLLRDPEPAVRAAAAMALDSVFGLGGPRLDADLANELLRLLGDPQESVRVAAVSALGSWWGKNRSSPVPDRAIVVLRELLQSREAGGRFMAAMTINRLGPAASVLLPDLLARLASEDDAGVRMVSAFALTSVEACNERVVAALIGLLEDPAERVRYAAASGLALCGQTATAALPVLRDRLVDASEANDVRQAAAETLAEITVGEQCGEVLEQVLECRGVFEGAYEEGRWAVAVGRLASAVPHSAAAAEARSGLIELSTEGGTALEATSSLARMACAERDKALGVWCKGGLEEEVRLWRKGLDENQWRIASTPYQPVIEALIELSSWPEVGVDVEDATVVLDKLMVHDEWWVREWATKQRARLP